METLFSPDTISAWDFLQLATAFILAMAVFFGQRNRKHWLNFLFIGAFVLHWINAMVFKPLPTKMFVTLLLTSIIVVETAVRRRETGAGGTT